MGGITPNPQKRSYLLPAGCKDLVDVLKGTPAEKGTPVESAPSPKMRVNGKIRATEVRVFDEDDCQLSVLPLAEALALAKSRGIDRVEVDPSARPPGCRMVDFGKFRYEWAKRHKKKS
jgi:hypothetical protein